MDIVERIARNMCATRGDDADQLIFYGPLYCIPKLDNIYVVPKEDNQYPLWYCYVDLAKAAIQLIREFPDEIDNA